MSYSPSWTNLVAFNAARALFGSFIILIPSIFWLCFSAKFLIFFSSPTNINSAISNECAFDIVSNIDNSSGQAIAIFFLAYYLLNHKYL